MNEPNEGLIGGWEFSQGTGETHTLAKGSFMTKVSEVPVLCPHASSKGQPIVCKIFLLHVFQFVYFHTFVINTYSCMFPMSESHN